MFKKLGLLFTGIFMTGMAFAAQPAAPTVTNIAGLRALGAAAPQYPTVQVLGYTTANDGGGGLVEWSPASTATADLCMTYQATGVTTGRYVRVLGSSNTLSALQCGVKADSSTDNSTALQAAFNAVATYNIGEVFCPATSGTIKFGTTLVPGDGMVLRGQRNNINAVTGSTSTAPGVCSLVYTGTSWAIDYQTPFQSIAACPSVAAPRFYDFNLTQTTTGKGIRFNNSSTAGFTDDCVAAGGGQSQVFGGVFDGVYIFGNSPNPGIQINKAFDTTITNSIFYNHDIQIDAEGSDNLLISNNKFAFAYTRSVDLQARGTFGNFNTLRDNTFFTELNNASEFVRTSARSGVIDGNYFETDNTGLTSVINVNQCSLSQTITNNAMELIPANVTYWLSVTGDCISIILNNNYSGGGGNVPANWNSGTGSHVYGGSSKQIIQAYNNPDSNSTIPYVTRQPSPDVGNNAPAVAGSILGSYDSSNPVGVGGNFSSTIKVGLSGHSGDFNLQPIANPNGHITFQFGPQVTGAIDLWVLASGQVCCAQTFTINDGVTTGTVTLTGGTTPTWYKAITNDTVTNPVIDTNNNNAGGFSVFVTRWQAVKH